MPIRRAVEMMWLQPKAAVGWTWNCGQADETPESEPPPLYFWFIPLVTGADHDALEVTGGQTNRCSKQGRWRFEWTLINRSSKELPLTIKIWTPIGAKPCIVTSSETATALC